MKVNASDKAIEKIYDNLMAGLPNAAQGVFGYSGDPQPAVVSSNFQIVKDMGGMASVKEINLQLASLVETMEKLGIHTGKAGIAAGVLGNNLAGLLTMNPYIWTLTAAKGMLEYASAVNGALESSLSLNNNRGILWLKYGEMGITPIAKSRAENDELKKIETLGASGSLKDVRQYIKDAVDDLSLQLSSQADSGQPALIYDVVHRLAKSRLGELQGKILAEKFVLGKAEMADHNKVGNWAYEEFNEAFAEYKKGKELFNTSNRLGHIKGKNQHEEGSKIVDNATRRLKNLGLSENMIEVMDWTSASEKPVSLSNVYPEYGPSWKLELIAGRLNVLRQMEAQLDPKRTVGSVLGKILEANLNQGIPAGMGEGDQANHFGSFITSLQDNLGENRSALLGGNIGNAADLAKSDTLSGNTFHGITEESSWQKQLQYSREGIQLLKEVARNTAQFSALAD